MPETAQEQSKKKRRRGGAIFWSLIAFAGLASVDAAALALARQTWQRLAPAAGRELFDAKPVAVGGDVGASRYRFNPDLVRYVAPNGKTIVPAAVKQQVATFNERAAVEANAMTRQMTAGKITVGEWQTQAATFVRSVHVASFVVGRGGLSAAMTSIPIIEGIVRYQISKLQTFAIQVATPERGVDVLIEEKITLSDAAAESRLPLYTAAANGTFEQGHGAAWDELRKTGVRLEMRNILQAGAEHCVASGVPGCTEETNRSWVPFGAMSTPGSRSCKSSCLCRLDYRRAR